MTIGIGGDLSPVHDFVCIPLGNGILFTNLTGVDDTLQHKNVPDDDNRLMFVGKLPLVFRQNFYYPLMNDKNINICNDSFATKGTLLKLNLARNLII